MFTIQKVKEITKFIFRKLHDFDAVLVEYLYKNKVNKIPLAEKSFDINLESLSKLMCFPCFIRLSELSQANIIKFYGVGCCALDKNFNSEKKGFVRKFLMYVRTHGMYV